MTNLVTVSDTYSHQTCMQSIQEIIGNFGYSSTTAKIINTLFSGTYNFCKLPGINNHERFFGSTGYIDGIKPEDMSAPIMRGLSPDQRPFIAFLTCTSGKNSFQPKCIDGKAGVDVLFQRYANRGDVWVEGGRFGTSSLLSSHTVTDKDIIDLTRLVDNRAISKNSFIRKFNIQLVKNSS